MNVLLHKESPLPVSPRYTVNKPRLICSATISPLRIALVQPDLLRVRHLDKHSPHQSRITNPMIHCWGSTSSVAPSLLPPVARLAHHPHQQRQPECLGRTSNSQFCHCTRSRSRHHPCSTNGATPSVIWPRLLPPPPRLTWGD